MRASCPASAELLPQEGEYLRMTGLASAHETEQASLQEQSIMLGGEERRAAANALGGISHHFHFQVSGFGEVSESFCSGFS